MIDESIFRGKKLAVVGNICRDVKTAPIAPDPQLFEDGETPTGFLVETIGGGGANSALSAVGLGADVRLGGKVGVDALGERLEALMVSAGREIVPRRDPVTPTGTSIALSFTNGCRHFVSCQPNNDSLCFEDIDLAILAGGGHLLRADLWFSEPMLFGGNARLLAAAQDRGMATSIDLNWDPLWGSASEEAIRKRKQAVRQVLPLADSGPRQRPRVELVRRRPRPYDRAGAAGRLGRQGRRGPSRRQGRRLLLARPADRRARRAGAAAGQHHRHRRSAEHLHDAGPLRRPTFRQSKSSAWPTASSPSSSPASGTSCRRCERFVYSFFPSITAPSLRQPRCEWVSRSIEKFISRAEPSQKAMLKPASWALPKMLS